MTIEIFRKKPITVETMLWDGTPERAEQIKQWVGRKDTGEYRFLLPEELPSTSIDDAHVWNEQEHGWIPCPVGHRIVKDPFGDLYPVSPEGIAGFYEPADAVDLLARNLIKAAERWRRYYGRPAAGHQQAAVELAAAVDALNEAVTR